MKRLISTVLVASAVQGFLLYWGENASGGGILAAIACMGGLALCFGAYLHFRSCAASTPLVTGAVGGLGMMLGGFVDSAIGGALPLCHVAAAAIGNGGAMASGSVFNWMNGLMLVFCLAGCMLLCGGAKRGAGYHLSSSIAMLVGMVVAGRLVGPILQGPLGAWEGMHVAMLGGMMGGTFFNEVVRQGGRRVLTHGSIDRVISR